MAHVEKNVSMQQNIEQFVVKQRRVEVMTVRNVAAKTVLVESANQFSLEEFSRKQYSLKYITKSYRPSDRLKILKCGRNLLFVFVNVSDVLRYVDILDYLKKKIMLDLLQNSGKMFADV